MFYGVAWVCLFLFDLIMDGYRSLVVLVIATIPPRKNIISSRKIWEETDREVLED